MQQPKNLNRNYYLIFLLLCIITMAACSGKQPQSCPRIIYETLIKDLDGDGKMDSVFLWYFPKDTLFYFTYVECRLSILNFKSITCKDLDVQRLHDTPSGFSYIAQFDSSTVGEYEFTYNSEEKNMQLANVKVWVGGEGNILESECYFRDGTWICWNSRPGLSPNPMTGETSAVFLDSDIEIY